MTVLVSPTCKEPEFVSVMNSGSFYFNVLLVRLNSLIHLHAMYCA